MSLFAATESNNALAFMLFLALIAYVLQKFVRVGGEVFTKIDHDNSVRDAAKGGFVRLIEKIFKK